MKSIIIALIGTIIASLVSSANIEVAEVTTLPEIKTVTAKELDVKLKEVDIEVADTFVPAEEPPEEPEPVAETASASTGDVESTIRAAARKYGVDENFMMNIARCESTFNPYARNTEPVIVNGVNYGHAEGLFQFIPDTWIRMSTQAGFAGYPVTDLYANANTAAWAFSTGHRGEWEC